MTVRFTTNCSECLKSGSVGAMPIYLSDFLRERGGGRAQCRAFGAKKEIIFTHLHIGVAGLL